MRVAIASAVLSLGLVAVSQSLAGLPACAQTVALNAATNSGCSSLTAECLCQNSRFVASLQNAIDSSCSGTDQQTACAWGNSACSAYGVTIPCGGSSNAAATTSPAASNSATSTDNNAGGAAASVPSTGAAGSTSAESAGTSTKMGATGSMTSGSSSVPSTLMTGIMVMNGTMPHTSVMNSTQLSNSGSKPTSSSTSSRVTSQYTGAASAAVDDRAGIVGAFAGVALVFALF